MNQIAEHHRRASARACILSSLLLLMMASGNVSGLEQLETMNVTATRTARTADETLASVTVITREDIEKSQAKEVVQLMDGLPGVSFTSYGGYGKTTSLNLRGTNASQVLVLVDGIRVGSATLGEPAWQHIPLSQVERIEVVRGPVSHLYGSDAIGGVVQIFTRKGAKGTHIDGEIGYGTYNTFSGNLGLSGGTDSTRYSLRLTHLDTEGFDSTVGNNPDKDGYRNTSFSGNLSHSFGNGAKLQFTGTRAEGNNQYDGFDPNVDYDEDFVQQALNLKFLYSPAAWWDVSLAAGESRDESEGYADGSRAFVFETRRPQASWQNDFMVSDDGVLTAGLDFLRDEVDGTTEYSETTRDNYGIFAQYQDRYESGDINVGLRHDDNESFGGHTTGNLALGYDANDSLRLIASYGTAFKAPTFNDLYYQDPWGSNGNPDLEPEESSSFEVGLEGTQAWGGWSLRAYRTDIDNLIQWVQIAPWTWQPQNISSARIDGLETALTARLAGWNFVGSLTFLDPRDRNTGNLLPARSKRTLRLDADQRFGNTGLGATLRAHSYRYDDVANNIRLPGYGLLDLRLAQHLTKGWSVRAQIKNLFDKDYQTRFGYNEPGREIFVSLVYQPE